jgi:AAHS family 4-hydroxybenzoate transporter-like MFS transporter
MISETRAVRAALSAERADAATADRGAIEQARFGSFQGSIVGWCALVAMLDGFDTQAIAYVAPSIAAAWQVESAGFGPIFGAGLLGLTIGALTFSPLADRFGRKALILLCVALFGIFSLLTASAQSLNELMMYRVLTGIGLGGAMPNIIALTNEYAPARMKATLVTVMFCGFPLGSMLGGFISVPLIQAYGWQSVFIAGGVVPLALVPLLFFFLPESIRFLAMRPGAEPAVKRILAKIDASASSEAFIAASRARSGVVGQPRRFPVFALFDEGRARRTGLVWTAFFANLLVMYFLVNWLPSLVHGAGFPLDIAILSTALLNLGGVVGGIVLGRLIDRRNPYLILGGAYAGAAVCIALIASSGSNVVLLLGFSTLAGVGVSGAQIGLNAVTAASYPTEIRATAIGWALGIGRVGSILGPVIGGLLLGIGWSPAELLLAAVVPALIAAAAVLALRNG